MHHCRRYRLYIAKSLDYGVSNELCPGKRAYMNRQPKQTGNLSSERLTVTVKQAIDLALQHHSAGRLVEAESIYQQILQADPNQVEAMHLLGVIAHQAGKNESAVDLIKQALAINPDFAEALNNLGIALQELERLDEARENFQKAIAVMPDYVDAYYNLGNVLKNQGKLAESIVNYQKALILAPDTIKTLNNLGNAFKETGLLDEAALSFIKALNIKPDFAEGWYNYMIAAKALGFSQMQNGRTIDLYDDGLSSVARATIDFSIFRYYINKFRPHEADDSFRKAMAALPAITDEEIIVDGTEQKTPCLTELPHDLVALVYFGRSGTGLLHSLIDGHPEISTLPSQYMRGYFNAREWNKIATDGWRHLPERFADKYAVLFDASSSDPVPSRLGETGISMGVKEGMTTVGKNRNETLSLNRVKFNSEALRLLAEHDKVDPGLFFKIVHAAYERVLGSKTEKNTVLYHIHNPDEYAELNFLRYVPNARFIMMIREPVQSCESSIREPFRKNDYGDVALRIIFMLFAIDQVSFRRHDSVGVRLEDLKRQPKQTMKALCAWLGIKETPSLYKMTAQGKKWWGDPTSPDYDPEKAMSPFGNSFMKRNAGTIFSERDQFILRTIFYPFRVRFGYADPDPAGFEKDLKKIRLLLDDMFDFEKTMSESSGIEPVQFKRGGSYLLLRASLQDRWNVLNELKDYPHMIRPLIINKENK